MPYSYEPIPDKAATTGVHWRVRDDRDNRVATCYDEGNARLVVMALNFSSGEPVEWVCGHMATAACAQCHFELAGKAHELAERELERG